MALVRLSQTFYLCKPLNLRREALITIIFKLLTKWASLVCLLSFQFFYSAILSAEFGQRKLTSKELKQYMPIPKLAKYLTLGICVIALLINIGQFASIQNVKKASGAGDTLKFLDALSLGTMLDFSNDV